MGRSAFLPRKFGYIFLIIFFRDATHYVEHLLYKPSPLSLMAQFDPGIVQALDH
jgi:hypothetical protein